jgi:phosphosulfolactate phosphohydrolase-like enzyme
MAPERLLLVCSGTFEEAAYEDVLGAGALCDLLWPSYGAGVMSDSAQIARRLFLLEATDLSTAVARSRNGRRLLVHQELREDVPFCLQRDLFNLVAELGKDGAVRCKR